MHTDRHTLVCTQSVDSVSDGDGGGWGLRGWEGGYCGTDFGHCLTFIFVLEINNKSNVNVL